MVISHVPYNSTQVEASRISTLSQSHLAQMSLLLLSQEMTWIIQLSLLIDFTGAIWSTGIDGIVNNTDDQLVLGIQNATLCPSGDCQVLNGSQSIGPGNYYLEISGKGSTNAEYTYFGNLSVARTRTYCWCRNSWTRDGTRWSSRLASSAPSSLMDCRAFAALGGWMRVSRTRGRCG